jgi:CubicO group peptidase (beta-lactamase class C family)
MGEPGPMDGTPICMTSKADTEIVDFLSHHAGESAEKGNFNGVVFYARDKTVLFHKAYGIANREKGAPNEITTRFNLASASKMFTAVAIGKLVEEGRLSFDDPIGKHLGTDWVSAEAGKKVLVRHILNHTSGLGMYWGEKWEAVAAQIQTIDDFRKVVSDELAFEPGTREEYSNTGYIMLGAIIEKVSGETYYNYVQRTIFAPCGMTSTGFYATNRAQDGFAVGYFEDAEDGGKLKDNLALHGNRGASAGGGWSTASDLHRFFLAMRDNRIVKAAMRAVLWSPRPLTPKYGYGFQIGSGFAGPGWVGHDGGFPGVEAFVTYHPATGHTLVVLSNYYDSALPLMEALPKQY